MTLRWEQAVGAISRRGFLGGLSLAAVATSPVAARDLQSATRPQRNNEPAPQSSDAYLFCYFKGNGEDGLHLAWSEDGLKYIALQNDKPLLKPEVGETKLMRDPCIFAGPDGMFHMTWTTSWRGKTFGYASSKNLLNWSEQKAVSPFSELTGLKNIWAPEIVYDEKAGSFMVFWSSSIEGRYQGNTRARRSTYNHRLYYTTTRDFTTWSEAKLLLDPGFSTVDGTFVKTAGGELYLVVKDDSDQPEARKHLRCCRAESYTGPFGPMQQPFTQPWVEGPSVIGIKNRYVCFYDCYGSRYYSASETTDFVTWREIRDQISLPRGIRHGTFLKVSREVIKGLL